MYYLLIDLERDNSDVEYAALTHEVVSDSKGQILAVLAGKLGVTGDDRKALQMWLEQAKDGDVLIHKNARNYTPCMLVALNAVRVSRVEQETVTKVVTQLRLVEDSKKPNMKKKSKATKRRVE